MPGRYGEEDRLKDSNAYKTHFQKDTEQCFLPSRRDSTITLLFSFREYVVREKLASDHLFSLFLSHISSTSAYSLRNHSYPLPFTKKSAALNSFLPQPIILWNTLPFDVQSSNKACSNPS